MKEKKKYEKPALSAVSLRSSKSVANDCWSPNSAQREHGGWYNTPGFGGLNFMITTTNPGNCGSGGTTFTVQYYIDNSGKTISEAEFYSHHPELSPSMIESECRKYVQGNWPGFMTKDPSHLNPNPPDWPWSM